jgi:hypothetical protein
MDAQFFFDMMHTRTGPTQHAGDIGANFNVIVAFWLLVEHIVEANDRTDFCRLQL